MAIVQISMVKVQSAAIKAIGYNSHKGHLLIQFKEGAIYRYENVPAHVHAEFMLATSKREFFKVQIEKAFRCKKIQDRAKKVKVHPVVIVGAAA